MKSIRQFFTKQNKLEESNTLIPNDNKKSQQETCPTKGTTVINNINNCSYEIFYSKANISEIEIKENIKKLVSDGVDINATDKDGKTVLMEAIEYGSLNIVKFLVSFGARVDNSCNYVGNTALHMAVERGNAVITNFIVEKLIESGCSIDVKNSFGDTALILAIKCDDLGIAKILIDKGADINAQDKSGNTVLMKTVMLMVSSDRFSLKEKGIKYYEFIELLIKKDANLNIKNNFDDTILHIAAKNGCEKIVKLLISQPEININAKDCNGSTALILIAERASVEVIKIFIAYGADVNVQDENGVTALMRASVKKGNTDVVNLLVKSGADVNAKDNDGNTALHIVAEGDCEEVVKLLISQPEIDTSVKNQYDETALMKAASTGSFNSMVQFIFYEVQRGNIENCNKIEVQKLSLENERDIAKSILAYTLNSGMPNKYLNNLEKYCDDICRVIPCVENELKVLFKSKLINSWFKVSDILFKFKKDFFNKTDNDEFTSCKDYIQDLSVMIAKAIALHNIEILKLLVSDNTLDIIITEQQKVVIDYFRQYIDDLEKGLCQFRENNPDLYKRYKAFGNEENYDGYCGCSVLETEVNLSGE